MKKYISGSELIDLMHKHGVRIVSKYECMLPISEALNTWAFGQFAGQPSMNLWAIGNGPIRPDRQFFGTIELNILWLSSKNVPEYKIISVDNLEEIDEALSQFVRLSADAAKTYRKELVNEL